jgi:ATP/maltotriose-dependent transcriptional regulator MalT
MSTKVIQIRIVVASPGDTATERLALERVVEEINHSLGNELAMTVALTRWETDAAPGFSTSGSQGVIDGTLDIDSCDIFIGVFWKRFGTPVFDSDSGTVHEFQRAYRAWQLHQRPQILFYFCEQPYSPRESSELDQWKRVLEFKKQFPKEGLWWPYPQSSEFERLVRRHLVQHIVRLSRRTPEVVERRDPQEVAARRSLFVGRTAEVDRLLENLKQEDKVLVVLEGIAGIGKSSLGHRVLERLREQRRSTFWLECHTETTLDTVTWEISKWARTDGGNLSAALDEVPGKERERIAYLSSVLARYEFVLFLDNYHLAKDPMLDALVTALCSVASQTKVVLISRRRPPLLVQTAPGSAVEEHLAQGLDEAACAEFLRTLGISADSETVRKARTLTGDGHPKALQLLAHRARRIPISQLLSSLPVFRIDIIREWLDPLLMELDKSERAALLDIAVFERPIPFSDIHRIMPDREVDAVIASLLERFLLDPVSEHSFQMHPLVREFCAGLIEDPKGRHQWAADYYKASCGPILDPEFAEDGQIDALLAAWSHYMKAMNQTAATEVADILRLPLMNRGHYEQVLQLVQETSPPDAVDAAFFKIHSARLRSVRGDIDDAKRILLPLLHAQEPRTAREAVLVLSAVLIEHGHGREAWTLLDENRDRFFGAVSARAKLRFLSRVVQAHLALGDYDKALEWARKLTEVSEAAGDKVGGAMGLRQMAESLLSQGKCATALELSNISFDLFQDVGRVREAATSQLQIARILCLMENVESARSAAENALDVFTSIGDRIGMSQSRQVLRTCGV